MTDIYHNNNIDILLLFFYYFLSLLFSTHTHVGDFFPLSNFPSLLKRTNCSPPALLTDYFSFSMSTLRAPTIPHIGCEIETKKDENSGKWLNKWIPMSVSLAYGSLDLCVGENRMECVARVRTAIVRCGIFHGLQSQLTPYELYSANTCTYYC